jgi:sterol desaturase/sphingolipid hydroxylase (fatty acid hydroxylase superfamily)
MEFSSYFFDSHQRVFWLYLLSSFLIAFVMIKMQPKLRSYFSKEILWHKSARLDYIYFVLNGILKAFVILPLLVGANEIAFLFTQFLHTVFGYFEPLRVAKEEVVLLYTLSIFTAGDFTRYWLHRFLHTVPVLWRFHRVHHSAEVLNPLTFYRVHPVENILFGLRHALSAGVVTAVFIYLLGAKIGTVEFFGSNLFVFVFGMLGANLRHSHIPLRYGIFEHLLISPYMHQLHHTKEHGGKNFGGVLSIWDGMFHTRHVETTQENMVYGLAEDNPHTSVWSLFYEPFLGKKYKKESR